MAKRKASITKVEEVNKSMRQAWKTGWAFHEQFGMQSEYGKMKKDFKGGASEAEKMRKYRGMSQTITEEELDTICELCLEHNKALGTTFLVAISAIKNIAQRKALIKQAINKDWGISELTIQVRRINGDAQDKKHVGRKRRVDLSSEITILEQLAKLCLSWTRFNDQLKDPGDRSKKQGAALLSTDLQKRLTEISTRIAELQKRIDTRKKRLNQ